MPVPYGLTGEAVREVSGKNVAVGYGEALREVGGTGVPVACGISYGGTKNPRAGARGL